MAGCPECREELEQLRVAADSLSRSVEQVEPPPGVKASLMEIVEREARERPGAPARRRTPLRWRLRGLTAGWRPALVLGALALGLLAGFGVARLVGDDGGGTRTLAARVDRSRIPQASARLQIDGTGKAGAILRVQGMPPLKRDQVYQAWVQRDGTVVPEPSFEVGAGGRGAVAVPDDVSHASAVLVTREARGGARAPSEQPILTVPL